MTSDYFLQLKLNLGLLRLYHKNAKIESSYVGCPKVHKKQKLKKFSPETLKKYSKVETKTFFVIFPNPCSKAKCLTNRTERLHLNIEKVTSSIVAIPFYQANAMD